MAIEGKAAGLLANLFQVFVAEMEIATQQDLQRVPNGMLERFLLVAVQSRIKSEAIVGMRRGDHMSDAVGRRHPRHLDCDPLFRRPVIQIGQDVAMNIHHSLNSPAFRPSIGAARKSVKNPPTTGATGSPDFSCLIYISNSGMSIRASTQSRKEHLESRCEI